MVTDFRGRAGPGDISPCAAFVVFNRFNPPPPGVFRASILDTLTLKHRGHLTHPWTLPPGNFGHTNIKAEFPVVKGTFFTRM